MYIEGKISKFLRESSGHPVGLLLELLDQRGNIIVRIISGSFDEGQHIAAPDPFIPSGVMIQQNALGLMRRDGAMVGDHKAIILEVMVAETAGAVNHVLDAFCRQIAEALIVPSIDIPWRQIFRLDFGGMNRLRIEIALFILDVLVVAVPKDDLFYGIEITFESVQEDHLARVFRHAGRMLWH